MASVTEEFFAGLAQRGHDPALRRVTCTGRFDIRHNRRTDHYLVSVKKGRIGVSREKVHADCRIEADRAEFDRIIKRETHALAASLRGTITIEGDRELLVLLIRLFREVPDGR